MTLVQGLPDMKADVTMDGQTLIKDLVAKQVADPKPLVAGAHRVEIRPVGQSASVTPPIATDVAVHPGTRLSVAVGLDAAGKPLARVYDDATSATWPANTSAIVVRDVAALTAGQIKIDGKYVGEVPKTGQVVQTFPPVSPEVAANIVPCLITGKTKDGLPCVYVGPPVVDVPDVGGVPGVGSVPCVTDKPKDSVPCVPGVGGVPGGGTPGGSGTPGVGGTPGGGTPGGGTPHTVTDTTGKPLVPAQTVPTKPGSTTNLYIVGGNGSYSWLSHQAANSPTSINAGNSGLAADDDHPPVLAIGALGLAVGSAGVLFGWQRRRAWLARRQG
ncbi:DUF4397 domain-containing protein [Candidatus Frankia alpina]|uniref:DUF4397 domain-containing protein n=1 Tax=Candidatus Frankia alpina TaxID=2699483 RepID=UPI001F26EDDC|nr:DUF4397 domain-containing protein [Candidatus Frankia alpina]